MGGRARSAIWVAAALLHAGCTTSPANDGKDSEDPSPALGEQPARASEPAHESHPESEHPHSGPCEDRETDTAQIPKVGDLDPLKAIKSEDPRVREKAISALAKRGAGALEALDGLIAAFEDEDAHVRLAAVDAVGEIGPGAARAIDALIGVFDDPASFRGDCGCVIYPVRIAATRALGKIGEASIPKVIAVAQHELQGHRECVAVALGEIGIAAEGVLPALTTTLSDDDPHVRESAADSLGNLGPAAKSATPALERARRDPNKRVSAAAELALEKIRKPRT